MVAVINCTVHTHKNREIGGVMVTVADVAMKQ